ncbi:uncharacterized protein LY89DRAFT_784541 [Mollisia scopiformis]|uniref:Uncharacterized protein n=1 Tax=Mollisia scopiformis TaxID=149040 RepID=A0A194X0D4_MOLSC|nr:uncharacterized protein LY89DRAFT_784541 [Mollisia scopiformis]KUJ13655.1 hypothetical protein LY89DRAFT_784541 [Mollisia scopiformis]
MAAQIISPPVFWTTFTPTLRTCLRNHFSPDALGAIIEDPNSPSSLSAVSTLGTTLLQQNEFSLAEELLFNCYKAKVSASNGKPNADILATKYNIAYAQLKRDAFAESEKSWKEILNTVLDSDKKVLPNLGAKSNLGYTLNKQGKFEEAEPVLTDLLPEMKERFHESNPRVLGCMRHLMEALVGQGKVEEAMMLNEKGSELVGKCEEQHKEAEREAMDAMRASIMEQKLKSVASNEAV